MKVGDRVEVIRENADRFYNIGDKGVIKDTPDDRLDIVFDNGKNIPYCFPDNFKLVEEKEYIIYDKTDDFFYGDFGTKEGCLKQVNDYNDGHIYELIELGKHIPVIKKTVYTLEE